jgi:ribose 5-phosphate isomerase B
MNVAIASDHAGFELKEAIIAHLKSRGINARDLGPQDTQRVDYPDFAQHVAKAVASGDAERGILVCGSGIGMAITANKVAGVRAATIHNGWEAEMSRRHNNANVACFGQRSMGQDVVLNALDIFLSTEFDGGRHAERVAKVDRVC